MAKKQKPLVYIPPGAGINIKDIPMPPPKTKYDKRVVVFPRDEVKKQVTKKDTP